MYKKKDKGPRTDPCGTPTKELTNSILSHCMVNYAICHQVVLEPFECETIKTIWSFQPFQQSTVISQRQLKYSSMSRESLPSPAAPRMSEFTFVTAVSME